MLMLSAATSQVTKVDTVMLLDTISISGERYQEYSSGQIATTFGEEVLQENKRNNIGNILSENTSVYIRSYGQGSVSSMSIRGTSSSQSGFFWNGINIRMPSLGSTDLSLIPSSFFDNTTIVYGGSSIRYGSGTIGGAVFLNNKANFSGYDEFGLDMRTGSFGSLGANASATISRKKIYFRITIDGQESDNDFPYINLYGEEKTMENASYNGLGVTAHAAAPVGGNNQIDLFLWYQEGLREIPATLTMSSSEAYQSDRAIRSSLQWKSYFQKGVLNIKTAWFNENENFTDPQIALQSSILTNTYFLESEYRHQLFSNASLDGGISMTAEQADIDAYNGTKDRAWLAAFVNYKQYFPRIGWNIVAGARQEISGSTLSPFTPSVGVEGPIFTNLDNKLSVSRNYRLPTMNELYWQPGGNPDIKAENSWNAEYSLISRLLQRNKLLALRLSATAFSSLVDDWILWLPQNNLWYADNISKVWARGVELGAGFKLGDDEKHADLQLTYTYSKSTNESNDADDGIKGKQLIYTPLHNAAGKLSMLCNTWKLVIFGNYTGNTYLSPDNTRSLSGFFLSDISLRKDFIIKKLVLGIYARANNIFDTEYQVVAYRPMPGRNFQLSLSITFKN